MNNKLKLTIGLALSAGTIAFCSWKFYKTWQNVKADKEAELEVKRGLEEDKKAEEKRDEYNAILELEELERKRKERQEQLYKDTYEVEEEEEEIPLYEEETGESDLRHHPDSREALNQFMMMNISDIQDPEVARMMDELYRIPLDLNENETVKNSLVEERYDFFGPGSKWNEELSISDLLFYYARMEYHDLDTDIEGNLLVYLENLGIYDATQMVKFDSKRLPAIHFVNHELWHDGVFGMFGLDDFEVTELIDTAVRTQGNKLISFQAEYNKHLEALI